MNTIFRINAVLTVLCTAKAVIWQLRPDREQMINGMEDPAMV